LAYVQPINSNRNSFEKKTQKGASAEGKKSPFSSDTTPKKVVSGNSLLSFIYKRELKQDEEDFECSNFFSKPKLQLQRKGTLKDKLNL